MKNIQSPHDKFVRKILSDTDTAIDYFRAALPAHITEKLDFTTLSQQSGSYLSAELKERMLDIIYTCRRRDGGGEVEISLLLEHKSHRDRFTPVQIGGYLFSGYQRQIEQKRKQLSPIIPILLYHGKSTWEYPTMQGLFVELDDALLGYIPKYDYIYHNLTDQPEEAIRDIQNRFLVTFLLNLKYVWKDEGLKALLPRILEGLIDGTDDQRGAVLIYNFELVDFTDEQIKELVDGLPSDLKDKVMNTYDRLIEKGAARERANAQKLIEQAEAKAEQKAYEEKLKSASEFKKMGIPIPDIAKGLQLPLEVLEKL